MTHPAEQDREKAEELVERLREHDADGYDLNIDAAADAIAQVLADAREQERESAKKFNALCEVLAHMGHGLCDDSCDSDGGECVICSVLKCAHNDPLHFHHDGCPTEYVIEQMDAAAIRAMRIEGGKLVFADMCDSSDMQYDDAVAQREAARIVDESKEADRG